jgi:hypothetical protein
MEWTCDDITTIDEETDNAKKKSHLNCFWPRLNVKYGVHAPARTVVLISLREVKLKKKQKRRSYKDDSDIEIWYF